MNRLPPNNRQPRLVTVDEILAELLAQQANSDLPHVRFQEVKTWSMRFAVLGLVAGWILLGTAASTLLFLVTRSNLAFAPLTTAMVITPFLVKSISRFLFWSQEDYKLEALRQALKVRKWELKYQSHRIPQA